jgi:hypothetical protein
MKVFACFLATVVIVLCSASAARALSVDEIVRLKEAGVSDSTIELLIRRDTPSAGVWREDGWIVYSTESRFPDAPRLVNYQSEYPITVYPQIYERRGRRHKPR